MLVTGGVRRRQRHHATPSTGASRQPSAARPCCKQKLRRYVAQARLTLAAWPRTPRTTTNAPSILTTCFVLFNKAHALRRFSSLQAMVDTCARPLAELDDEGGTERKDTGRRWVTEAGNYRWNHAHELSRRGRALVSPETPRSLMCCLERRATRALWGDFGAACSP